MEETTKNEAQLAVKPARAPLEFIPKNLDDAWRVSELVAKSGILPDALRGKPHDLLVTIMTGAELGLSPMQSIRSISVVKGKGYLDALLKVALVKQSPECEYFRLVKSDATVATFTTKRRGEGETTLSFTIAEAKAAQLGGRSDDNWAKYPALMLRRRASSQLADEVYPDVVRGIAADDELPPERELNAKPATYAPPAPPAKNGKAAAVDAEVVPPTPPPAKKSTGPAPRDANTDQPITDPALLGIVGAAPKPEPTPEPKVDGPREEEQGLDAAGILMKLADAKGMPDVDALAPLAQKIQGPLRSKVKEAFKNKRAEFARLQEAAEGAGVSP